MPTHTFETQVIAGTPFRGSVSVTNDTELNADLVLASSSSDVVLTIAFTKANCQSLALYCTADCTVKFYETSTLRDTITLTAGVPTIATSSTAVAALLSTSTAPTSVKLTCADGGTFSFRAILSQN